MSMNVDHDRWVLPQKDEPHLRPLSIGEGKNKGRTLHPFLSPRDPRAWEDPDDTSPKPTSDLRIDVQLYREGLACRWEGITSLILMHLT